MKALTLAAGISSRLYPLTAELPKCLLPVGEQTILDHQITHLIAAGISELVIVVGYKKELIMEHLAARNYPLAITYIENEAYTTTRPLLGGLLLAHEHLTGTVLFFHCDVLFDETAIPLLVADPRESVLLCRQGHWDAEAGKIITEPTTGRVLELGKHIEESRATGEYLQIAKFGPSFCKELVAVVDKRAAENRDGYTIDAFDDVVRQRGVEAYGLPFTGLAAEIDTPEDYAASREAWERHTQL